MEELVTKYLLGIFWVFNPVLLIYYINKTGRLYEKT